MCISVGHFVQITHLQLIVYCILWNLHPEISGKDGFLDFKNLHICLRDFYPSNWDIFEVSVSLCSELQFYQETQMPGNIVMSTEKRAAVVKPIVIFLESISKWQKTCSFTFKDRFCFLSLFIEPFFKSDINCLWHVFFRWQHGTGPEQRKALLCMRLCARF